MPYVSSKGPRGSGRTYQQIETAPEGALFIWAFGGSISYPKGIAERLNRTDIEIVCASRALDGRFFRGRRWSAVIMDHACRPNEGRYEEDESGKFVYVPSAEERAWYELQLRVH